MHSRVCCSSRKGMIDSSRKIHSMYWQHFRTISVIEVSPIQYFDCFDTYIMSVSGLQACFPIIFSFACRAEAIYQLLKQRMEDSVSLCICSIEAIAATCAACSQSSQRSSQFHGARRHWSPIKCHITVCKAHYLESRLPDIWR